MAEATALEAAVETAATTGDGWVGRTKAGAWVVTGTDVVPNISSVWESNCPSIFWSLEDVPSKMEAAALAA